MKFNFKKKIKRKIYLTNKFNYVTMGFSFVLDFPANSSELKWEDLFPMGWSYFANHQQVRSQVKTLQAQIAQEYFLFFICQDKNPIYDLGPYCKM